MKEIKTYCQLSGLPIVVTNCRGTNGEPFAAIKKALANLASWAETHTESDSLPRAKLRTHESPLQHLSGSPGELTPEASTYIEERPTWFQEQFASYLLDLSNTCPFVLVFEDIEDADAPTIECISRLVSCSDPARYLLVLTTQPTSSANSPFRQLRDQISKANCESLALLPLGRSSLEILLEDLFPNISDKPALVDEIHRITGGQPVFLDLVIRKLYEDIGTRSSTGEMELRAEHLENFPVPDSISGWVRQRLSGCSQDQFRVLGALAVLNRPAPPETLRSVLGETINAQGILSAIPPLLERGILSQAGNASHGPLSFAYALFRHHVYDTLEPSFRQELHGSTADLILSESPTESSPQVADIAHHLFASGRLKESAGWFLRAGNVALAAFSLSAAETFYRTALENLEPQARIERLDALEGLSETLNLGYRHAEAADVLKTLVRQATEHRAPDYLARGLAGLAEVHLGASQYEEAEELSERALRIAREIQDPRTEARVLKAVADTLHYQSKLPEAKSAYTQLVALREGLNDELGSARGWHNLGWVCNSMRRFEEAATNFKKAELIYRRLGNITRLAHTLSALGANELDAGNFESAVGILEDALRQAQHSRGKRTEALCHANLGQARFRLGHHNDALNDSREARRILLGLQGNRYLAPVELTLGWILTDLGDYSEAEKYLCSAREAHLALEDQPGLAMCLAAQATIHRVLGDPTAARFWCERALEIARGSNDAQVTAICLTTIALAWLEEGENLQAIDSLIEARSLAREVGAADTEHLACLALARILLYADRLSEVPGLLNRLIERAETMHLAADIPAVLYLQALFRCRLGDKAEAIRLVDEALARSEEASSAETRWELRHFRLFFAEEVGDEKTSERLHRELQTWIQSCATTVPEDEKRKAFLRRIETQRERLQQFLAKPAIRQLDDGSTAASLSDLPAADPLQVSEGTAKPDDRETPRQVQPTDLLREICASDHERSTLKSVLNLLVDRAVHATYSARGGLFLLPTALQQTHLEPPRESTPLSPLCPIALRNLERESLHDAHDMSHSVLRAVLNRGDDITSDDLIQDPQWEEALTERIRRIPAILAIPVLDADTSARGLGPGENESSPHTGSSRLYGVIYLERDVQNHPYSQEDRRIMRTLAREMARVFASLASAGETWNRIRDLQHVIDRLDTETLPPSERIEELAWGRLFGDVKIVGASPAMADVFERTRRLGTSRTPVLITGETGTGKEVIARALHQTSPWHDSPFVAVDCGALTENLAEAELFGHARGAFSGAERERQGLLRSAGDGTFFLDEIGNLAPGLQLKLLRALETGEVRPVGSDRVHAVHCRLVAASNSDLSTQMRAGKFRPDLFHRLQGGTIHLPPLRERMEDLDLLMQHLLTHLCAELEREKPSLSPAAWHALQRHQWPGNVRELRMALQFALAMNPGPILGIDDLPDLGTGHSRESLHESTVKRSRKPVDAALQIPDALEGRMLLRGLAQHGWDKAASAREIGWSRQKLYRAMKTYGIPLQVSDDQLRQIQEQAETLLLPLDSPPEPRKR